MTTNHPTAGGFPWEALPFLTEGRCGIYEDRPMSCRQHWALTDTAYWCAPERSEAIRLPFVQLSMDSKRIGHFEDVTKLRTPGLCTPR
jgi:Fe-S-cluster containining protein